MDVNTPKGSDTAPLRVAPTRSAPLFFQVSREDTRCNELKVLALILVRSEYGREVVRTTDKTVRAKRRTWTVEVPVMSVHGPAI